MSKGDEDGSGSSNDGCITNSNSKQPKSEIHQKMLMFEQLKNQVLLNSKNVLTPH